MSDFHHHHAGSSSDDDADLLGSPGSLDSVAFTAGGASGVVAAAAPRASDARLLLNRKRRGSATTITHAPPQPRRSHPAAAATAGAEAGDANDESDDGDADEQEAAKHLLLADDGGGGGAIALPHPPRLRADSDEDENVIVADESLVDLAMSVAAATQRTLPADSGGRRGRTSRRQSGDTAGPRGDDDRVSSQRVLPAGPPALDGGSNSSAVRRSSLSRFSALTAASAAPSCLGTQRVARALALLDDASDDDDVAPSVPSHFRQRFCRPEEPLAGAAVAEELVAVEHQSRPVVAPGEDDHHVAPPVATTTTSTARAVGEEPTPPKEGDDVVVTLGGPDDDGGEGVTIVDAVESPPPPTPHEPQQPQPPPRPTLMAPHTTPVTPTPAAERLYRTFTHPSFAATIADCGLPDHIAAAYAARGVVRLFPWQARCLRDYYAAAASGGTTIDGNLLYTAPTSGGKTLVAEVIMLRAVLGLDHAVSAASDDAASQAAPAMQRFHRHQHHLQPARPPQALRKKALFVVPYVAIAEEKADYFTSITSSSAANSHNRNTGYGGGGLRVLCHAGSKGQRMLSADIHVCTMEKANVLLTLLMEQGRADELALVAIDELHQLGEPGRGHVLELLITKLLDLRTRTDVRIVGMSATLTAAPRMARWLDHAYLFVTDFRPVPLREHYVVNGAVFDTLARHVRALPLLAPHGQGNQLPLSPPPAPDGSLVLPEWKALVHTALKKFLSASARLGPDGALLALAAECLRDRTQCLVFCPTRDSCTTTCRLISQFVRTPVRRSELFRPSPEAALKAAGARVNAAQLLHAKQQQKPTEEEADLTNPVYTVESVAMAMLAASSSPRSRPDDEAARGAARRVALAGILGAGGRQEQQDTKDELTNAALLAKSIPVGVALHSAALTSPERAAVERAFRDGGVWALCCTTTLAAGVNLPARRVIFRSPKIAHLPLDATHYRQAAGRAGRAGLTAESSFGESYLIGTDGERPLLRALVEAALPPIKSNFAPNQRGCARLLLEGFNAGVVHDPPSVRRFLYRTLFAATAPPEEVTAAGVDALGFLEAHRFIRWIHSTTKAEIAEDDDAQNSDGDGDDDDDGRAIGSSLSGASDRSSSSLSASAADDNDTGDAGGGDSSGRFVATKLGAATAAASLSPDEALALHEELKRAKQRFVLGEELHVIYMCAPLAGSSAQGAGLEPKWPLLAGLFAGLPEGCRLVADAVGVSEAFIEQAATCPPMKWAAVAPRGVPPPLPANYDPADPAQQKSPEVRKALFARVLFAHRRFYVSLILRDIVREVPLAAVAKKFGITAIAELHRLMESSCTAASTASAFAERIGYWFFPPLLDKLTPRLQRGVAPELVPLARLPGLTAFRARSLYRRGFRDPAAVAVATTEEIEAALAKGRRGAMTLDDDVTNNDHIDGTPAPRRSSSRRHRPSSSGASLHALARALVEQAKAVLREDAEELVDSGAGIVAALGNVVGRSPSDALRRVLGVAAPQQPQQPAAAAAERIPTKFLAPAPSSGGTTPRLPKRAVRFRSDSLAAPTADGGGGDAARPEGQGRVVVVAAPRQPRAPSSPIAAAAAAAAVTAAPTKARRRLCSLRELATAHDVVCVRATATELDPSIASRLRLPSSSSVDGRRVGGATPADIVAEALFVCCGRNAAQEDDDGDDDAATAQAWVAAARALIAMASSAAGAGGAGGAGTGPALLGLEIKATVPSVAQPNAMPQLDISLGGFVTAHDNDDNAAVPVHIAVSPVVVALAGYSCCSNKASSASWPVAAHDPVVRFVFGELLASNSNNVVMSAYGAQRQLRRFCRAAIASDARLFSSSTTSNATTPIAPAVAEHASLGSIQRALAGASTPLLDPLVAEWSASPDDRAGGRSTSLGAFVDALSRAVEAAATGTTTKTTGSTHHNAHRVAAGLVEKKDPSAVVVTGMIVLARLLVPRLVRCGSFETFLAIEAPMPPVLAWLEVVGMPLETAWLGGLRRAMAERCAVLVADAQSETKRRDLSLTSPQQCAQMLFDVLRLPSLEDTDQAKQLGHIRPSKSRRSGLRETRSTRQTVLLQLQRLYPDVGLPFVIQEHRTLTGWDEKFIEPLVAAATPSLFDRRRQRVHGSYFHTATATGRLAMGEPNLQTIPHPVCFRVGPASPVVPLRLRDAFAARSGGFDTILVADFAQIEARLLAHFSRDPALVAAFTGGGSDGGGTPDVFVSLAADVFRCPPVLLTTTSAASASSSDPLEVDGAPNISCRRPKPCLDGGGGDDGGGDHHRHRQPPPQGVTPAQRQQCKTLCYGMLYGRGAGSIAEELGMDVKAAEELLDRFRATYAVATSFLRQAGEQALRDGYVASVTGRRRPLPTSTTTTANTSRDGGRAARAAVERVAVNTLCQGSAADLVKLAMVRLVRSLAAMMIHPGGGGEEAEPVARLVHQVHDELVLEVASAHLSAVARATEQAMSGVAAAFGLSVPFPVKLKAGRSWGSLKPFLVSLPENNI